MAGDMWIFNLLFSCIFMVSSTGANTGEDCTVKDHLNCTVYKYTGMDCSLPSLYARFPALYNATSDFPGAPKTFESHLAYDERYVRRIGLTVTFTPVQNVGIKFVKGFEISYVRSDSVSPTCYVFDMSNASWRGDYEDKMTVFRKYIGHLKAGSTYSFDLYSLPKPDNPQFDDFKSFMIKVPPLVDLSSPSQWQAAIGYDKFEAEGRVSVSFNKAPAQFNFSQFYVSMKDVASGDIPTPVLINDTVHNFTNVKPGNYTIRVTPHDPYYFSSDPSKCLCVELNSCVRCFTTETPAFEMKYISTPPPPTTTHQTPSTSTNRSDDPDDPVGGVKVGLAVLGAVVGVALAVAAVFIYYCRCREGAGLHAYKEDEAEEKGRYNEGCDDPDMASIITVDGYILRKEIKNNKNANRRRFSKRLKLFLLYEEDSEYHRHVVTHFATYLQQHAQCDVMCAEWHLDAPWIQPNLESADYIIIVNSAKAYVSYMNQFAKRDCRESPKGRRCSTSINSIRNKFLNEQSYDSIVMVHFDYTDENYLIPDICPGYRYKLMKNFTEFLRHIHKIPISDSLSQYDLPVDGNHNLRPIGQQLMDSIAKAEEYEKKQPRRVLTMLRTVSKTSEPDSQVDSGLPDENAEPRWPSIGQHQPSDTERQLQQYLDGISQDVVTIYPPDMGGPDPQAPQCNPVVLSPLSLGKPVSNTPNTYPPSPPTADSDDYQFDFEPPDDLGDLDNISKTVSEQMMSLNDRYHAYSKGGHSGVPLNQGGNSGVRVDQSEEKVERQSGGYNKDADLVLLQMNNEDMIQLDLGGEDGVSLGGQSV